MGEKTKTDLHLSLTLKKKVFYKDLQNVKLDISHLLPPRYNNRGNLGGKYEHIYFTIAKDYRGTERTELK